MRLPAILDGVPRIVLILAVPALAFAITVGVSLGTEGGNDNKQPAVPTVAVAVTNRQPLQQQPSQPQAQAAPTATPTTDRTDCNAIRGTDYRSTAEQEWFKKNCGAGGSTSSNTASSSGSTTSGSSTSAGASSASSAPRVGTSASIGVESPTGQRLVISKAKVNADIYITGMTGDKFPDPKGYFYSVAYDMAGYGGLGGNVSSGNYVMSGHVDCGKCNNGGPGTAVFWGVRDLQVGDSAQIYTTDGKVINYVVSSAGSYSSNTDYTGFVSSSAADLTIITCTGTFAGGEYDRRHVVQFKKA